MKKLVHTTVLLFSLCSTQLFAEGSIGHASKGLKHSAAGISHGVSATVKVAAAVVAVPLIVVGSIPKASDRIGRNLLANATGKAPLELTEQTISVGPAPSVMIQTSTEGDK